MTIIENSQMKIYGVQFHPEVTHTDNGKQIFKNFVFSICNAKKEWNIISQKNKLIKKIQKKIFKKEKVICALSGGVDSSVVALLINRGSKKKPYLRYG